MYFHVPKTLDNPIRCLGIPIDSLLVFMMVWALFASFNKGLSGIIFGLISANIFNRFRNRSFTRKLIRFIYWYLPSEVNFLKGIKGHQRKLNMGKNYADNS